MNKRNRIDISIVIGGNEKLILPCLNSIYESYKGLIQIFVTSNLSSQKTITKIKKQFPKVNLVINDSKKGFAENHNYIIKRTSGKYILILNDDTIILNNAVKKLLDYMENHPSVAAISPKLLNPDLSLQHSTYNFPTLFTASLNIFGLRKLIPFNKFTYKLASKFINQGKSRFWRHDKICKVDTMRGACVLVLRKAIKEVGLMDEVSLIYGEETEWHYRFKRNGWNIIFYPKANIIHYGKQSTNNEPSLVVQREKIKGLLNFFKKHKPPLSYHIIRLEIIITYFIKYIFNIIMQKKKKSNSCLKIIKIVLSPKKIFQKKRIF